MAEGGDGRREGGKERGEEQERGKMWETGRCGQGEVEREGDGVRLYFVPFTLTFGHYDLAGIRLTTLVLNIVTCCASPLDDVTSRKPYWNSGNKMFKTRCDVIHDDEWVRVNPIFQAGNNLIQDPC